MEEGGGETQGKEGTMEIYEQVYPTIKSLMMEKGFKGYFIGPRSQTPGVQVKECSYANDTPSLLPSGVE